MTYETTKRAAMISEAERRAEAEGRCKRCGWSLGKSCTAEVCSYVGRPEDASGGSLRASVAPILPERAQLEVRSELDGAGIVTADEADEILNRFNNSHWHGRGATGERARYSIPANPRRDDDIRLAAFIEQHRKMAAAVKRLRALIDTDDVLVSDMDPHGAFWTELAGIDHELYAVGVLRDRPVLKVMKGGGV